MILRLTWPCMIRAHARSASQAISRIARKAHADAADPVNYRCMECHLEWHDSPLRNPADVSCSNCYSDSILIRGVRLRFQNWGDQNGGEKEQRERYGYAATLKKRFVLDRWTKRKMAK